MIDFRYVDDSIQNAMLEERERCGEIFAAAMDDTALRLCRTGLISKDTYESLAASWRTKFKKLANAAFQATLDDAHDPLSPHYRGNDFHT